MSDILIVDDERDIRELISDILEDEGYATRLAGNSDDAMSAVKADPPALLILDIWLKDSRMDGIDILKAVKRDNPDVPVVIISGHGNIEIAVAAIKQGAYDFIEKPFNIDQLLVVIRRAMETSRLRRENTQLKRKDTTSAEMIGASAVFRTMVGATRQGDEIQWPGIAGWSVGRGQGNRRALYPHPFFTQGWAFRRGRLRLNRAGPHGRSAVWPRDIRTWRRTGASGGSAWRGDLF